MALHARLIGAAAAAFLAWVAPAGAQTPIAGSDVQAAYDRAFQDMLGDPANLEKTFKFAELAVQVGNFEGAISALERMLLINPNLPRVRLELGVLYYRLGSFDAARGYFESVRSAPDTPQAVRDRVDEYLSAIATQESPHSLSGSLTLGLRFQTNANSATNKPDMVRSPFGFLSLPANQRRRSDINMVAIFQSLYRYDLQAQDGHAIEANLLGFGTLHGKVQSVSVGLGELTVGPRLFFPQVAPGFNIRPYGLANYLTVGGVPFYRTFGTGLSFNLPTDEQTQLSLGYDMRFKRYYVNADAPNQRERDAVDNNITAGVRHQLHSTGFLGVDAFYRFERASRRWNSNRELGLTLSYTHLLDDYLGLTGQPWSLTGGVTRSHTVYGEPDPSVDPTLTRRESKWEFLGVLQVPVADWITLQMQVQQQFVNSTYEQNRFGNLSTLFGVQMRF